jgi:hypothetical protein
MYALIIGGQIIATGPLPAGARDLTTGEWVTPHERLWTPGQAAACGWFPVTAVARPADTAQETWDYSITLVGGLPTEAWTERPKTQEELAAETAIVLRNADRLAVQAIITDLQAEKDRCQVVIDKTAANITGGDTKDVARAAKRIADAAIDLARFVKGL